MKNLKQLSEILWHNKWEVFSFQIKQEAAEFLFNLCENDKNIGINDSNSVYELNTIEKLKQNGNGICD